MKKTWWQSFLHLPRAERNGMLLLSLVLLGMISFYISMSYWDKPPRNDAKERELILAMQQFLADSAQKSYAYQEEPAAEGILFPFDPNTLDSAGFIRLGLRPKTTHMLLNWRRKGKIFYRPEQFKDVWTLKPEEYERLAPYIQIAGKEDGPNYANKYTPFRNEPIPATIDLNITDSALLVRLNGIGPTLAHKIIERRKALGGFLKHDQLNEIYRFPDTTFNLLREKLVIHPEKVRKLMLNQVSEAELAAHPYIGEKMARNIILLRNGLHGFQNIQQLRQVPLMNEENYRKIAPYFTIQ